MAEIQDSSLRNAVSKTSSFDIGCRFLDRLPVETRIQVYGYLLSVKYTKEYKKTSDDLEPRTFGHPRYHFHPQILCTSRKVFSEATEILYEANSLVTFDYSYDWIYLLDFEVHGNTCGLPIVAKQEASRQIAHRTTIIEWFPEGCWQEVRKKTWRPERTTFTFAALDMTAWCTALVLINERLRMAEAVAHIKVRLGSHLTQANLTISQSGSTSLSVEKIVEPLRGLYGFEHAEIQGLTDREYADTLISELTKPRPLLSARFSEIQSAISAGDEAANAGQHTSALSAYSTGIQLFHRLSHCLGLSLSRMLSGAYRDFHLMFPDVCLSVMFTLSRGLAQLFLRIEDYEEALPWATYAMYQVLRVPQHAGSPLNKVAQAEATVLVVKALKGCQCAEGGRRTMPLWLDENTQNAPMRAELQKLGFEE